MALFPRFSSGDFTPLFRLLDDYDVHRSAQSGPSQPLRSFSPRFDVRELKDAYHLDGELPGIDRNDVDIEFTDSNTLVVKGRSTRGSSSSNDADAADETSSNNSHQPTVEDADEPESSSKSSESRVAKANETSTVNANNDNIKYWVSERSVGEFSRTFTFPIRVDQDAVKASLRNGILSIVVPKALAPTSKRIIVE